MVDESASPDARLDLLVDVRLRSDTEPGAFEAALTQMCWITEAIHVTGVWDYQLRVRLPDTARLDELVRALKRESGAETTQTRLVLRTIPISGH